MCRHWALGALLFTVCTGQYLRLLVSPEYAFLSEDWPVGNELPEVYLCALYDGRDPLRLAVTNGDELGHFRIGTFNDTCWTLALRRELDADQLNADGSRGQTFSLTFRCTDSRVQTSANLYIQVQDINDNEPLFMDTPGAVSVSENTSAGEKILSITTVDPDSGVGGINDFILQDDFQGTFRIGDASCSNSRCTADLFLERSLNYETKHVYKLLILATDGAGGRARRTNSATFELVVNVLDVQNNPPRFVSDNRIQFVREDTAVGARVFKVEAVDGDTGASDLNKITYAMLSGTPYFNIDPLDGWVLVTSELDREKPDILSNNGAISLTVLAQEENGASPKPSSHMNLTVLITDVDDQSPQCAQPLYKAQILENSQHLVPLTLVEESEIYVFDRDEAKNAEFRVSLAGDDSFWFDVSPQIVYQEATLVLRVKNASALDFEQRKRMQFEIVLESNAGQKTGKCEVSVEILDQNDNAPYFNQSEFVASVPENAAIGTVVAFITAFDNDTEKFRGLTFELGGIGAGNFAILSDGTVKTAKILDREQTEVFHLTVTVTDDNGRGKRRSVPLEITVLDENDNHPVFEKEIYTAFLVENTQQFTQMANGLFVKARDSDKSGSQNTNLTYWLEPSSPYMHNFTINHITGQITPNFPGLDREQLESELVNLTVIARDNGEPSFTAKTQVHVFVNDSNDNHPIFERTSYDISIPENATEGDFVVRVTATDNDQGKFNGKVLYRIEDIQDKFTVNSETGAIVLAKGANLDLDLSGKRLYELTVLAVDQGFPQLTGSTAVNIKVRDVNNKSPKFAQPIYQVSLMEHSPLNMSVVNLTATDPDESSILQYRIVDFIEAATSSGKAIDKEKYDYTSLFAVKPKTGELYLKGSLDREQMQSLTIRMGVLDINGIVSTPQTAECLVQISVLDSNDNAPVFGQALYMAQVQENSPLGTVVVTLSATDPDSGSKGVRYSLMSDGGGLVTVDEDSGQISVAGNIDFEEIKWINITVSASDKDTDPKTSKVPVNIRVLDQNDNSPIFYPTSTYTISVAENAQLGLPIVKVQASDKDSGSFGRVSYFLLGENEVQNKDQFEINSDTGQIMLKRSLDRERTPRYSLTVRAVDDWNGAPNTDSHEATAVVEILVTDINDSAPKFGPHSPKQLALNENDLTGSHVTTFVATDADDASTPNAQVQYFVMGGNATSRNGDPLFSLDPEKGVLSLARDLTGMYGVYSLVIEARDKGFPRQSSNHSVSVVISDYNDHKPTILQPLPQSSHYVYENNFTEYQSILQVKAIDKDQGKNAQLYYAIKESNANQDWQYFDLDAVSGQLYPLQALDFEKQSKYALTVTACDKGVPPQCAEVQFFVVVVDQNDHCPYFERAVDYINFISVPENNELTPGLNGTVIGQFLSSKDADSSAENRMACYEIVTRDPINAPFHLRSPKETTLVTNRTLDREFLAQYTVVIQVHDCVHNQHCTTFTAGSYDASDHSLLLVRILIEDQNDLPPHFTQKIYLGGGVQGHTKIGTRVARIRAIDLDSSDEGRIQYTIDGAIESDLTEGSLETDRPPFFLNSTTGDVVTNIVFQPEWKGAFHFGVLVTDSVGHEDRALVTINLLSYDQQVELLFESPANKIWDEAHDIIRLLSEITESNATIDDVQAHHSLLEPQTQSQSSVLIHFVGDDEQVIPIKYALRSLDMPRTASQRMAKQKLINVHHLRYASQSSQPAGSDTAHYSLYLALAIIIGGLLLVMFVLIGLWCVQNHRYKRKLKAATTFAFGAPDTSLPPYDVPGTNLHSNSNPLWKSGYGPSDNFALDFDRASHNSLDENELNLTEKQVDAITSRTLSTGSRHNGYISTPVTRFSANYVPYYGSDTVNIVQHGTPNGQQNGISPEPPNYPLGPLASTEL